MNEDEKRRRQRVDLGSDLLVRIGDTVMRAECVNVSMSGALLDLELRLDSVLETKVELGAQGVLDLAHRCGAERLSVSATFSVVRVEHPQPTPNSVRLGVHFTGLDTASSIHLFNLIRWQGG